MRVEHVGRIDRRRPLMAAAIAVVLVAVAITKPWPGSTVGRSAPGVAPGRGGAPATQLPASAGPTPLPTAVGDQVPCLAPAGWRLATLEVGRLGNSRSWSVVTPGTAAGPLDAITSLSLRTEAVLALGFCAPDASQAASSSQIIAAWRLTSAGPATPAAAVPLRLTVVPQAGGTPNPVWATLYRAPPVGDVPPGANADAVIDDWPSGHYVFEVADPRTAPVWFALDLIEVSA